MQITCFVALTDYATPLGIKIFDLISGGAFFVFDFFEKFTCSSFFGTYIYANNGKVNPNANGKYVRKTNTLYLKKGLAVAESYTELFKHEFMHSLESKKLYDGFKDYLFKESPAFYNFARFILRNAENENAESGKSMVFEEVKNEYLKRGYKESDFEYELVADFFAKQLLTGKYRTAISKQIKNDDFAESVPAEEQLGVLEELKVKKPSLLQKIKDIIRELINKLRGYPQAKSIETDLTYLDNYVERLINSKDIKNTDKNAGEKFSYASTNSNVIDISGISELNKAVENLHGSKRYNIIRDFILMELSEQPIKMSDGRQAYVDKSDAKHISSRSGGEKVSQISKIKSIIETAKLIADEDSADSIDKFSKYYYYEAFVKYGKDIYPLYVNVGITKNDKTYHIYDITKKLRDTAHRINDVGRLSKSFALKNGISTNNIPNNSENVNKNIKDTMTDYNFGESYFTMSYEQDSDGNKLSAGQQEYFKDSKVRDENGNLLVVYHGTPNADFTVFNSGTYFTKNKEYADLYQSQGASSLGYKKTANNPDTYAVYLNIKKPFDTRNKAERDIFKNEYYRKYGTGTDLMESGLPDWLDGMDLQEFLEEKEYDYDGLILDEGATGGYGEEVKSRGISYVVFNSSQVKNTDNLNPTEDEDIRFSSGMLEQIRYNPEAYTKRLLKNCKIPANEENVKYYSDKLKAITRLHNKGKGSRAEYEFSLKEMASELAENIPDTITNLSKEVISYIKGKKVSLTKTQIDEIENLYGSIKEWSKVTGLKVRDDAIGLDSLWQGLRSTPTPM